MSQTLKTLATIAMLAVATLPATAQTAADDTTDQTDQPAADDITGQGLSMGDEVSREPQVGDTYRAGTFIDWDMRCVKTENGEDPCQLYQLLNDQEGNSVAEISIFGLPGGQRAAAGATIITPLETLLTAPMTLAVDGGTTKQYPYNFCAAAGCFVRIGFTEADITAFKRGNAATLTIVPAIAPDQKVNLSVSLKGFTAGFDAVNTANNTE